MVDTKSHDYSNLVWLSECRYSALLLAPVPPLMNTFKILHFWLIFFLYHHILTSFEFEHEIFLHLGLEIMARSNQGDTMTLHPLTNVPTKYHLPTPYSL